jgi:hypothetical protein
MFFLKGTVSRDFQPLVFMPNNTPGSTDLWAKVISTTDSYLRRYSTTKSIHAIPHSADSIFFFFL